MALNKKRTIEALGVFGCLTRYANVLANVFVFKILRSFLFNFICFHHVLPKYK